MAIIFRHDVGQANKLLVQKAEQNRPHRLPGYLDRHLWISDGTGGPGSVQHAD